MSIGTGRAFDKVNTCLRQKLGIDRKLFKFVFKKLIKNSTSAWSGSSVVKSLPLKHEDPSLDPQHPGGKPGVEEASPCKSWHWGGGDQHIPERAG